MLNANKSEIPHCENCGKELTEDYITILTITRSEEIILCDNCFIGMTAQKIWETCCKEKTLNKAD